jgi:hypothetical protein
MPHAHSVEPARHNVLKGRDVLAPELHRDWEEGAGGCKIDVNWGYEHSLSPDGVAFVSGSNVRPELSGNFRE